MSEAPSTGLQGLLTRLHTILGPDSLLLKRLETGLCCEDESMLADAIESLRLYPLDVQTVVEDEVLSWLFGPRRGSSEARRSAGGS